MVSGSLSMYNMEAVFISRALFITLLYYKLVQGHYLTSLLGDSGWATCSPLLFVRLGLL